MARNKKVKKAKKGLLKRVAGDVSLAPLLPFRPLIKRMLGQKGVSTKKMKFRDEVKKFNELYIKKGHLEETFESLENPASEEHLVSEAIDLVQTVINYIKNLKARRAKGEPLTADEMQVLQQTDKVENDLAKKQAMEANKMYSQMTPTNANSDRMGLRPAHVGIGIVGIVVIILVIMMVSK